MKIYDTFVFGGSPADLDLLECRLYELGDDDPFHAHVIVEGSVTHSGLEKPWYFAENRERFARWEHKIRYVQVTPGTEVPGAKPGEAWAREGSQRQGCALGLRDAGPDDLIIHGDVDEILTAGAITELALRPAPSPPVKLQLTQFSFAVDWQQPWTWHAPSVARFGDIGSFSDLRYTGWPDLRMASGDMAGWHLSWVGGPEAQRVKARSFAHTEWLDLVLEAVESGRYYEQGLWYGTDPDEKFHNWEPMIPVDVDETWPRWVHERKCPANWYRPRNVR